MATRFCKLREPLSRYYSLYSHFTLIGISRILLDNTYNCVLVMSRFILLHLNLETVWLKVGVAIDRYISCQKRQQKTLNILYVPAGSHIGPQTLIFSSK